jgi:hypothetical protein
MEIKELLSKNVEGLDESLDMLKHYIRETLIWRHRANELASAIIANAPEHDITMMAASIHKQLANKSNE